MERWRLLGRRARWLSLIGVAGAASLIVIALASANNVGGFEIDADHTTPSDALYSGNNSGDDWAQGTSNNGVFQNSPSAPHTAATDCYGSNIDKNPLVSGVSTLICDGNSDSRFRTVEPEQSGVSPAGKTPDDVWPVKPTSVHGKDDFSHAYVHASVVDSPCDSDSDIEDVVLHLGGHVGDNEGSHFWGFEFMKNAPTGFASLKSNDGSSFNLDFNRQVGDLLVSFTVPGSSSDPVQLELFRVSGFDGTGDAIYTLAGAQAGCPTQPPNPQPQGFSLLTTNNSNDVKAPPWNVPVCDPTADNNANTCRLANGTTPLEDLLAPRDFAEASVDLTAFGISPCFTNIVFSSRSSHPLEGADIKDVGGGEFPLCGKKSGTKFYDRNADGDKDTGEEGLGGWPIRLYRDANNNKVLEDSDDGVTGNGTSTVSVVNTAANGTYEFTSLQNGNYIACERAQPPAASGLPTTGWSQSLPNSGTTGNANCIAGPGNASKGYGFTMSGADHPNNDFGNYRNGTKTGTKFEDLNGDGDRDSSEPGVGGVPIHLFGLDGSGTAVHRDTTTAADGTYSISAPPGSYTVCETVPSGYTQSFPTSGPSCTGHEDASGLGYSITLTSEQIDSGNDFGNFRPGTKSGTKFDDLNANGIKDPGEPGLGGVQIHLVGMTGLGTAIDAHQTTAADGTYSITVPPGNYTACETVPAGYTQSFPTATTVGSTACTSPHSGRGWTVVLTSNGTDSGNDFGNFRQATISGTKFKDADANGSRGANPPETGLSGWTIRLTGTDSQGAVVSTSTVTNASGGYSFTVNPGTYRVCEVISGKTGWVETFPTASTTGQADCTSVAGNAAVGYSATVTSGGTAGSLDFGNTPLSTATVTFQSLADLPDGSDATKATEITCRDSGGVVVGTATNLNTLTTNSVKTNQTDLTCVVKFVDP